MSTRKDVITQALTSLGVVRLGQPVDGPEYSYTENVLISLLYAINEDASLDFDPSDEENIPEGRVAALQNYLKYAPALDMFDTKNAPADRVVLFAAAERAFFANYIGESNYIEAPVTNF